MIEAAHDEALSMLKKGCVVVCVPVRDDGDRAVVIYSWLPIDAPAVVSKNPITRARFAVAATMRSRARIIQDGEAVPC